MKQDIVLKVNGENYNVSVETQRTLVEVLRETPRLHRDEEIVQRRANAAPARCSWTASPWPPASSSPWPPRARRSPPSRVLAEGEKLHPVQEAFVKHAAIQCGFCTPGMVLAAKALLDENPEPTSGDVRRAISGNLCRCTGYQQIVDAVMAAAAAMKTGTPV